jgi:hypothetical protein
MTRYTVVWDATVESQFINDWVEGDSQTRSVLTAVANWIDTTLSVDAENKGRAISGSRARMLAVPLVQPPARISVVFDVVPDDRQVRVVRIVFRTT